MSQQIQGKQIADRSIPNDKLEADLGPDDKLNFLRGYTNKNYDQVYIVDKVNGNDSNAEVDSEDKPYATITQASIDAQNDYENNDNLNVIYVIKETYKEKQITYQNVDYYFEENTTVWDDGQSVGDAIISDHHGISFFNVYGKGKFYVKYTYPGADRDAINIQYASNVYVEAKELSNTQIWNGTNSIVTIENAKILLANGIQNYKNVTYKNCTFEYGVIHGFYLHDETKVTYENSTIKGRRDWNSLLKVGDHTSAFLTDLKPLEDGKVNPIHFLDTRPQPLDKIGINDGYNDIDFNGVWAYITTNNGKIGVVTRYYINEIINTGSGETLYGIAFDSSNNGYVVDTTNQQLKVINTSNDTISNTLDISQSNSDYKWIVIDSSDNLYITDGTIVRKYDTSGNLQNSLDITESLDRIYIDKNNSDRIWVISNGTGNVHEIDSSSFTLTTTHSVLANPVGLGIFNDGKVWVFSNGGSTDVTEIESGSGTTTISDPFGEGKTIQCLGISPNDIIYVQFTDDTMIRWDHGYKDYEVNIDDLSDQLFITDYTNSDISYVQEYIYGLTPHYGNVDSIEVGSNPYSPDYNSTDNTIAFPIQNENKAVILDGATNDILSVKKVGKTPRYIEYHSTNNEFWVANYDDNNISVIDTNFDIVATIPVGSGPRNMAEDTSNGDMWITNFSDDSITIVDNGYNVLRTITGKGAGPIGIEYESSAGEMYIAHWSDNNIVIVNTSNDSTIDTKNVGNQPRDIVNATSQNKMYVAVYGADKVTTIDYSQTTMPLSDITTNIGSNPRNLTYHSTNDEIWVANWGDSFISVIDNTETAIQFPISDNALKIVYNSIDNKIYWSDYNNNSIGIIQSSYILYHTQGMNKEDLLNDSLDNNLFYNYTNTSIFDWVWTTEQNRGSSNSTHKIDLNNCKIIVNNDNQIPLRLIQNYDNDDGRLTINNLIIEDNSPNGMMNPIAGYDETINIPMYFQKNGILVDNDLPFLTPDGYIKLPADRYIFTVTSSNNTDAFEIPNGYKTIHIILEEDWTPSDISGFKEFEEYLWIFEQTTDNIPYDLDLSNVQNIYFDNGNEITLQAPEGGRDLVKAYGVYGGLQFATPTIASPDYVVTETYDSTYDEVYG